jgi:hypothetical protein
MQHAARCTQLGKTVTQDVLHTQLGRTGPGHRHGRTRQATIQRRASQPLHSRRQGHWMAGVRYGASQGYTGASPPAHRRGVMRVRYTGALPREPQATRQRQRRWQRRCQSAIAHVMSAIDTRDSQRRASHDTAARQSRYRGAVSQPLHGGRRVTQRAASSRRARHTPPPAAPPPCIRSRNVSGHVTYPVTLLSGHVTIRSRYYPVTLLSGL